MYHVLLTMKAYDETPISEHHFVPLVSLGGEDNKHISWGATVADKNGNYYYTSFSAAGFIAPYIFVKLLHLPICENSLYIFNSMLFIATGVVLLALMNRLFKTKISSAYICFLITALYCYSPEIMHSQGVIYWSQSLFQLLFITQLYVYQRYFESKSNKAFTLFIFLSVLNPYIEWSGFVSNIGFAFVEFVFSVEKKETKHYISISCIVRIVAIVLATFLAAALFIVHYLSVIPAYEFLKALFLRFNSRSMITNGSLFPSLIKGYCTSFGAFIPFVLAVVLLAIKKKVRTMSDAIRSYKSVLPILLVSLFVLLENIIMLQHAVSYSFDRMKLVVPIAILLLMAISLIEINQKYKAVVGIAVIIIAICNSVFYLSSMGNYMESANYLKSNNEFAEAVLLKYDRNNSVFIQENCSTRGYTNLLWDGGVYEGISPEDVKSTAVERGKRYIVCLKSDNHWWNMYEYTECEIVDMTTGKITTIYNDK